MNITVLEAAHRSGLTYGGVIAAINRDELAARRRGRTYAIDEAEFRRWMRHRDGLTRKQRDYLQAFELHLRKPTVATGDLRDLTLADMRAEAAA